MHPTQPRPGAAGTTSPRIPRACLSLHTGSRSQTLKETPKAPSRCFGPRWLPADMVLSLRSRPSYRVTGPDSSASTPDGQKLRQLRHILPNLRTAEDPNTPLCLPPSPRLQDPTGLGQLADGIPAPPPGPTTPARADLARRRSSNAVATASLRTPPGYPAPPPPLRAPPGSGRPLLSRTWPLPGGSTSPSAQSNAPHSAP